MDFNTHLRNCAASPWVYPKALVAQAIAIYPETTKREIAERAKITVRYTEKLTKEMEAEGLVDILKGFRHRYTLTKKGWEQIVAIYPEYSELRARQ